MDSQQPLGRLDVSWRGTTLVATLTGEIDRSNADELGAAIARSVGNGSEVVLDLGGLAYLDSAALTMIHKLALEHQELWLVAPEHSRAHRLLQIAGLDTVVSVSATLEDALLHQP